ncbi:hypothetical protein BDV93DRAFT_546720 [Ceratobasidium sp. AG-I]|nr:hypothetical protein BDV93DRAFT_546720 [Ceratobasidium sp. AG-I]
MPVQGTRDPNYYFEDGSVIFLVEGILFKIHRSLITSKSEVFRDMFQLPTQSKQDTPGPSDIEGSCDEKPILLTQVQARQFRHLLLFLYGVMTDPDYVSLILGAADATRHDIAAFERYLDIASLANRYCMTEIEAWAREQFAQVLHSSPSLSRQNWVPKTLLEALAYCKLTPDRELEHNVRNIAECYLKPPVVYSGAPNTSNVWVTYLYKYPNLKRDDPALFGHIFSIVLSAGHQSPLWRSGLSREDRALLFTAQVYLTPLPASLPTDWISDVSKILAAVDAQKRSPCFPSCSQRFQSPFNSYFNCRSSLTQNSPLTGVTALSNLPAYRQSLAENLKSFKLQCKCMNQLISALDVKMDALFTDLAEKYHGCLD